jgi:hypothetical protein
MMTAEPNSAALARARVEAAQLPKNACMFLTVDRRRDPVPRAVGRRLDRLRGTGAVLPCGRPACGAGDKMLRASSQGVEG